MAPQPLRVLIADPHPLLRRGLRCALEEEGDLVVVGETAACRDLLALARKLEPHVAVVELGLPGDGGERIRELVCGGSGVPVLVLSACASHHCLHSALAAGASGYLLNDEPVETIVAAVRGIAGGQQGWLSRRVAASLRDAWHDPLTPKETEVVRLLAEGNTAPEVASALGISTRTARNHLTNVYSKLDLHSQPELVAWAWRTGLTEGR